MTNQGNLTGYTGITGVTPGTNAAYTGVTTWTKAGSGYSWIVKILPYVEENQLYLNISNASTKFSGAAFAGYTTSVSNLTVNVAAVVLDEVACPSFGGQPYSQAATLGTGSA